jgi:hypothetical protein
VDQFGLACFGADGVGGPRGWFTDRLLEACGI